MKTFVGTCECCELLQNLIFATSDENGRTPIDHCETCRSHQGVSWPARAKRAEEHLPMHLVRENAARAAADDYEERMRAAYRSREHAVRVLRRLRNLHEAQGRKCACGVKDCPSLGIVESGWVREQISSLELRELQDRAADPYWDDEQELDQYVSPSRGPRDGRSVG